MERSCAAIKGKMRVAEQAATMGRALDMVEAASGVARLASRVVMVAR